MTYVLHISIPLTKMKKSVAEQRLMTCQEREKYVKEMNKARQHRYKVNCKNKQTIEVTNDLVNDIQFNDKSQIKLRSLDILELIDIQKSSNMSKDDVIYPKGIIYRIEHNTISNMIYIGQSIDSLGKRWSGHLSTMKKFNRMYYRLCFFMNYYGIENFSIVEHRIFKNIKKKDLDVEEQKYIWEMGTLNTRHANEDITIKITDEMRNNLINKFIKLNTNLVDLYKLIRSFEYEYTGLKLDFVLNDDNKTLLVEMLKKELEQRLIGMELRFTDDFKLKTKDNEDDTEDDDGENTEDDSTDNEDKESDIWCCQCFKIDDDFLEEESVLEDYLQYIDFFHKHFIVTNNKDDEYYSSDLVYGMQQYGEHNELFDFYFLRDFPQIMQHYFDIVNQTYNNVDINFNNNKVFGIKKKVQASFKFMDEIRYAITDSLQYADTSIEYELYEYIHQRGNKNWKSKSVSGIDVKNNNLNINELKELTYIIWEVMNMRKFKYDKSNINYDGCDEFRIMDDMDYSYDYYNMEWICANFKEVLHNVIEGYEHNIVNVNDEYLILDEY